MEVYLTYQQDTIKEKSLLPVSSPKKDLTHTLEQEKPSSVLAIPEPRVEQATIQKKTYTFEQVRKWRLQQENKLLIDSSKYINPRRETNLHTEIHGSPSVILPIRERNFHDSSWLTLFIFLGIIVFASFRYTYTKYIKHLFLSLFNYPTSARMLQEKSYPAFHAAYRLEAIFYITFSIFIYQLLNVLKWENALVSPTYFGLVSGMVLLYFFGKKFLYLILGSLFEAQNETREFLFNMDNFNRSLGLILLPVVILISYAPVKTPVFIVFSGLILIIVFYIILLQRGIYILLKKQFPIFYLFLYLCTLEFLPLLLIYKVVV